MSASESCRCWLAATLVPWTAVGFELKAKEVTPPPPGARPLASVPEGEPTMPVMKAVACTGARDWYLVSGWLKNMEVLQIGNGRRDWPGPPATRCAVSLPSAGLGSVTCD